MFKYVPLTKHSYIHQLQIYCSTPTENRKRGKGMLRKQVKRYFSLIKLDFSLIMNEERNEYVEP
jgi:hypothetical protein